MTPSQRLLGAKLAHHNTEGLPPVAERQGLAEAPRIRAVRLLEEDTRGRRPSRQSRLSRFRLPCLVRADARESRHLYAHDYSACLVRHNHRWPRPISQPGRSDRSGEPATRLTSFADESRGRADRTARPACHVGWQNTERMPLACVFADREDIAQFHRNLVRLLSSSRRLRNRVRSTGW